MKRSILILLIACFCFPSANLLAQQIEKKDEPKPSATKPADAKPEFDQAALDKKFEQTLSGSIMTGTFTVTGEGKDSDLKQEKYTVQKVTPMANNYWMFSVRIQYGEKDRTVLLPLEVKWAGDTPVITLTKFPVPGFGTFTSRVLIYDDHYAGFWNGGDHGGHLFGTIKKMDKEDKPAAAK